MVTNLREFLSSISKNIELGEDFDIESIPEVELPKNFNDEFHSQYLTPLSAKNNKEIMGHFKGQYLSNVDGKLKKSFLANGGNEETFNELKAKEPESMKLIELVLGKIVDLNSNSKATSTDDEFNAYKIKTSEQIRKLLEDNTSFEDKLKIAVNDNSKQWSSKLKNSMITSKLNAKQFNDSMSREDAIYLTMKKVENSPYILSLDENLNEMVYQKDNPEFIATRDGGNLTWDDVLDENSYDYTKKNDQNIEPPKRVVVAPSQNANSDDRYVSGSPNYGK